LPGVTAFFDRRAASVVCDIIAALVGMRRVHIKGSEHQNLALVACPNRVELHG
jgi:hypothetical protein